MPKAKPKTYVYLITRTDYNHYKDKKGTTHPIAIHATSTQANEAAKSYTETQRTLACKTSDPLGDEPAIYEQATSKEGLYSASCWTWQKRRYEFKVHVKKVEFCGAVLSLDGEEMGNALKSVDVTGCDGREGDGQPSTKKRKIQSNEGKGEGSVSVKGKGKENEGPSIIGFPVAGGS